MSFMKETLCGREIGMKSSLLRLSICFTSKRLTTSRSWIFMQIRIFEGIIKKLEL